ncbi:hypothetical protein [Thermocatellispora tengchongensis]|uniref:hypothetical protein n=1 Tax=Thermocatellispora tengchongensis TaxID=1073253 RepID=UPI003627C4C5
MAWPHTRPWHQPMPGRARSLIARASRAPSLRASATREYGTSSQRHTMVPGRSQECQPSRTG